MIPVFASYSGFMFLSCIGHVAYSYSSYSGTFNPIGSAICRVDEVNNLKFEDYFWYYGTDRAADCFEEPNSDKFTLLPLEEDQTNIFTLAVDCK